jgi:hypothetical protein
MSRFNAAILAGLVAILLNTAALATADLIPLPTAHGGLLRFLVMLSGGLLQPPGGIGFMTAFHILVGLGMALFYAFLLEPVLPGTPWRRGLAHALAVWLANACIVLPLTGEGFAGRAHLSPAGMLWFAVAHTLFFLVLARLYARLRRPPARVADF